MRHRRRPQPLDQRVDHRRARWWRGQGPGCASTGGAPPRRRRGRPTCSRRSGSSSTSVPPGWPAASRRAGIGFCFAPRFHPAMRFAIPVRRELGMPTVFNFLGPLANPARAGLQVVGVSDPAMADKMLGVLVANGSATGHGGARGRRPRRAVDHGALDGPRRRSRRPRSGAYTWTRPTSGWPRPRSTICGAATRRQRRGGAARARRGEGPAPRHRRAQRRGRPGGGGLCAGSGPRGGAGRRGHRRRRRPRRPGEAGAHLAARRRQARPDRAGVRSWRWPAGAQVGPRSQMASRSWRL